MVTVRSRHVQGSVSGYVAFSVRTWIIYTDHHRSPDHPCASLSEEVSQRALSSCSALKSNTRVSVSFVSICLCVSPNSPAGLRDVRRLLSGLYIPCAERKRRYKVVSLWPRKRSDCVDLTFGALCVYQRIRAHCDMTLAPVLHHDKDLCVCVQPDLGLIMETLGCGVRRCLCRGRYHLRSGSFAHLRCPSKPVYLCVSFVNISRANDWIRVDRLPGRRSTWAVWHHGIIRPRSAPMSTPALICILICC